MIEIHPLTEMHPQVPARPKFFRAVRVETLDGSRLADVQVNNKELQSRQEVWLHCFPAQPREQHARPVPCGEELRGWSCKQASSANHFMYNMWYHRLANAKKELTSDADDISIHGCFYLQTWINNTYKLIMTGNGKKNPSSPPPPTWPTSTASFRLRRRSRVPTQYTFACWTGRTTIKARWEWKGGEGQ